MSAFDVAVGYLKQAGVENTRFVNDEMLAEMKNQGLSITESIKAVRQVAKISLGDAKEMVSASNVWARAVKSAAPLHAAARDVLSKLPSP